MCWVLILCKTTLKDKAYIGFLDILCYVFCFDLGSFKEEHPQTVWQNSAKKIFSCSSSYSLIIDYRPIAWWLSFTSSIRISWYRYRMVKQKSARYQVLPHSRGLYWLCAIFLIYCLYKGWNLIFCVLVLKMQTRILRKTQMLVTNFWQIYAV